MELNKLVRDNIPNIISKNDNKKAITHVANEDEYHQELCKKLVEETQEYLDEISSVHSDPSTSSGCTEDRNSECAANNKTKQISPPPFALSLSKGEIIDHKKCVEELTDILEVVYALARYHHITRNELEQLRKEKEFKNGAFKKQIILEHVE